MPRFGRAYPNQVKRRQARPILFDAIGAGDNKTNGFVTGLTSTWSHTAKGPVIVGFDVRVAATNTSGVSRVVTYGGVAMTQLGANNYGTEQGCDIWGLMNPPPGAQTVSVACTDVAAGNTGWALVCNSVSYTGVGGFGPVTTSSGSATTSALTVSALTGELVAMVFGVAAATQSAFTQTSRYTAISGDSFADILLGDAPGAPSVSFASTLSGNTAYGGIGVRLQPLWN